MKQSSLVRLQAAVASLGGEIIGSAPPALRDSVTVRCSAGHEFSSPAAGIVYRSVWCPHCAGNARGALEAFQAWACSHGGECLSSSYTNSKTLLRFRCRRGHEFACQPREVGMGRSWCGECVRLDGRIARF